MAHYEQPTQPYPALPPGNGGGQFIPAAQGGYPVLPATAPYGSVPVVPPRRGAGFWVAVTAAVATGVILALLAGFFIGRGTRLSNSEAQDKIIQQAQADQIAQQQALSSQKAVDQAAENRAVDRARSSGEAAGLRQGKIQGQQLGYQQGQQAGFNAGQAAGQSQGFQQGQTQGFQQGQQTGQAQGFNSGLCAAQNLIC